jgi:insulysin
MADQWLDKPPHDDRNYRLFTLDNGVRVLLASDSSAEYASAAMCVGVGAAHDPVSLPGLAHFCEHMLFLGSEKYPEESAYKKFLAAHGGRSNASTSMEATVFKFEVLDQDLAGALDIFAQFFVAPLFTESATERELKAVDAEDSRNRTNDARRVLQVLKAAADADHSPEASGPTDGSGGVTARHPWTKFSTGNSTTLQGGGETTREALLDFHGLYYHGGNMSLALTGTMPLDEMEAQLRATFAAVPAKPRQPSGSAATALLEAVAGIAPTPATPTAATGHDASEATFRSPFARGCLPRLLHVSPLRELRQASPQPAVRSCLMPF